MRLATLAIKNVGRHKFRTALTAVGIAVAIILFALMRVIVIAWTGGVEDAATDRIGTRHKVTFIMSLPKKYVDDIGKLPGVARKNGVPQVTWASWFGGKDAAHPNDFFATIATDAKSLLSVYPEIQVDPKQAEAWVQDRRGALIGDRLADKMGWKLGQKIVLTGTIYPGNWELNIDGIYTSQRKTVDRSSLWFHWEYLNDSPLVKQKDQVGWIMSRIDEPGRSAALSKQIDKMFDERDTQTATMSEKALNQSFLGFFSAVLGAINVVTIAMGVRERTSEYGCLRAIGFEGKHITRLVVGESLTIGIIGGAIGLGIAYVLVNVLLRPVVEENLGGLISQFMMPGSLVLLSLGIAAVLAVLAAVLPAFWASKLKVTDALRTVE